MWTSFIHAFSSSTIENVSNCWHPPHCKVFKKNMSKGKMTIHTITTEESIYQSKKKGKKKRVRTRESSGCMCYIANHRPRTTSEKLLQFETSMKRHLKAKMKTQANKKIQMPLGSTFALQTETSVRKEKHQILKSEDGENKIPRPNYTSERDPDGRRARKT